MHAPSHAAPSPLAAGAPPARAERLAHALEHAAHLLPAQGPIGVFIHHNTLHAFQHLPFHRAVAEASATFGTEGYLTEEAYRAHHARGRVDDADLLAALASRETPDGPCGPLTRRELELLALRFPLPAETAESLRWRVAETGALRRLRADVPAEVRARLLAEAGEGLRAAFARVGAGWTLTDLAEALLGPGQEERVRQAAGEPRPPGGPTAAACLARLGVPRARQAGYLEAARRRAGPGAQAEAWLRAEARLLPGALAEAFDGADGLGALERLLARDPEALAVAALWAACRSTPPAPPALAEASGRPAPRTLRDALLQLTGEDAADLVHPLLVRLCAAFVDEGVAAWPMPHRAAGLYAAWRDMVLEGPAPLPGWLDGLPGELARARAAGLTATDVVLAALDELGVPGDAWDEAVLAQLLQLPGWAGMMARLERHPEERGPTAPPCSLVDFLAVRLTLDRHALRHVARRRLGYGGPLAGLREAVRRAPAAGLLPGERSAHHGPWTLFQVAQLAGLAPARVAALTAAERLALLGHLHAFDAQERRQVWHEAYERHYRQQVLHGLAQNLARPEAERAAVAPRFQFVFCFDDREEAIRRHVEEQSERHETFGAPGFFGVAIDYRGLDDPAPAAFCPVVATPGHEVHEEPHPEDVPHVETRRWRQRAWARLAHQVAHANRAAVRGGLLALPLGAASAVPLAGRILFPRAAGRARRWLTRALLPAPRTRLTSHRDEGREAFGVRKPLGFTAQEQADRVAAVLENIGLVRTFAPLVAVLGHGSVSVNNPHLSAYDCGACGGRHGAANARAFAEMANRPEVRARLAERGIRVPEGTRFVGGLHNTATDAVTLFDLEAVPPALAGELAALRAVLDTARAQSAHERCRRFASAPRRLTPAQALAHVEARTEDLSQARPELGHVTVAAGVVGRRALTRGLFLDRRAFVISYDPGIDATGAILERILLAAGPVGAGINLEYYFSCVDNERFGSGTKLPHNLAGLVGVMDGAQSDLRTGLPRQMVEIHEPVRLLLVVEASTATLEAIYARQAPIRELVGNGWVQLVSLDPATHRMCRFTPAGWEPYSPPEEALPRVRSSAEWYAGKDGFLPPALIAAPTDTTDTPDTPGPAAPAGPVSPRPTPSSPPPGVSAHAAP